MKPKHILCILTLLTGNALALSPIPEVIYPELPKHGKDATAFIPQGWQLENSMQGDLNADDFEDKVLILRMQNPDNVIANDGFGSDPFDTNPRMLVILFADRENGYRLEVKNTQLIPRPEVPVMDDYLEETGGVAISNGKLSVSLHLWSSAGSWWAGNREFTFRFQNSCFRLIGYDSYGYSRASGESKEISVNYLTGKIKRVRGNLEEDGPGTEKWDRIPRQPLRCLDEVGDGLEFQPIAEQ